MLSCMFVFKFPKRFCCAASFENHYFYYIDVSSGHTAVQLMYFLVTLLFRFGHMSESWVVSKSDKCNLQIVPLKEKKNALLLLFLPFFVLAGIRPWWCKRKQPSTTEKETRSWGWCSSRGGEPGPHHAHHSIGLGRSLVAVMWDE